MDWKVCFYLSADEIPQGREGIYLLFIDELLDYVGQSDDIRRRLSGEHHVYDRDVHTLIAFIEETEYGTRLSLERYFNGKYDPPNSFVGTVKQDSKDWHAKSAEERRNAWKGLPFEDFPFGIEFARSGKAVEFRQIQRTDNVMGAPSIITLKPKDLNKR